MMLRMLVPFDGSPAAVRALELVSGFDVQATLLNVQRRPPTAWPGAGLDPGLVERTLLDAGRAQLAPALVRLPGARGEVRLGLPADVIVHEARTHHAVVMGTRGAGALRGYALGSVALRVSHRAAVPVVLVKPADRLPAAPGKRARVLLAMDGSEPALRAAKQLCAWQGWFGELEVHLAYVQRPLSVLEAILPPHDDVLGQWSTQEGLQATQAARELLREAGIAQHMHLSMGDDPAPELRTLAAQAACDFVALGTRGLGAAHHALLGSVALKAAALCEVPVLLVP
jgi:nucleotide-binding universal stress UspA family protein